MACGLAVGNLYYAQPLLETVGRTFHVGQAAAGLIVTITQRNARAGWVGVVIFSTLLPVVAFVLWIGDRRPC